MEGGIIGRLLVIEFDEQDTLVFAEIMRALKLHHSFERLHLNSESVLSFSGIKIYPDRRKVYHDHHEINLTAKEYDIFYLLAKNIGRVLTYEQIYQNVWGEEDIGKGNNAVGCHVRNLRRKLHKASPDTPFSIRCVREVGYCFEIESEET